MSNSQHNKEYLRNRYASQRKFFLEYLGGECVKCGALENLEFDHVNPLEKSFPVSGLWPEKDIPRVLAELDKCQLLCKVHHIEKTNLEHANGVIKHPPFTHGTLYGWMKKKCTCQECLKAKRIWNDERNAKRRKQAPLG